MLNARIKYQGIALLFICFCTFHVTSQNHDHFYLNRSTPHGSGSIIKYDSVSENIVLDTFQWNGTISGSQIFSDSQGKMICYYNSRNIYDSIGRVAINGDSMAIGFFQNYLFSFLPEHEGLGNRTNCAFIPISDSLIYLLYMSSELWAGAKDFKINFNENGHKTSSYADGLYLTKLRVGNNKRIYIKSEEKHLQISDNLYQYNNLLVCKHGNGEDSWIIIPHAEDPYADMFLLQKDGEILIQDDIYFSENYWRIRSDAEFCFSEDGSILGRLIVRPIEGFQHIIELFKFNRCEGSLELISIDSVSLPEFYTNSADLAFSLNNKFMYLAIGQYVLQYELNTNAKLIKKDTIASWDGFIYQNFIPPLFDVFWTLPNNKLLIASGSSTPFMHIINEPNLPGDLCDFVQRAYEFPQDQLNLPFGVDIERLPRYPNYRMKTSECLPLSTNSENNTTLKLFPSIASDFIRINAENLSETYVFDNLGRKFKITPHEADIGVIEFSIGNFPPGSYYIMTILKNNVIKGGWFVKL